MRSMILRRASSDAEVLAYMDVDLSTDLNIVATALEETAGGETVYDLTQPLSGTA
jgi:hypothetical protein